MKAEKRIIITGASSGIGAALTRALAQDGHRLFVCARRLQRLDEVTQKNTLAQGFQCDVSQEKQVIQFIDNVKKYTGHIDVLINNAGKFGAIGRAIETDSKEWLSTIETNLFGTYLMVKHSFPLLRASNDARIINLSGGGAFNPFPNYSAYAASKAAVVRLTENLAVELADEKITVNALSPGFVVTEIHNATIEAGPSKAGDEHFNMTKRKIQEGAVPIEKSIECMRFLISDEAHGLTGKTLSASFDAWNQTIFHNLIPDINRSDLFTMKRINLVNLPDEPFINDLT